MALQSAVSQVGVNRRQAVVPLVVRQIKSCLHQEFKLFGTPVQIACIVGIIRGFTVQSCQITFMIEDHTGTIRAMMRLESESEVTTKLQSIKKNRYYQVFGSIRPQNSEKLFMIIKLFPVDDPNLITCHLLQVIYKRLEAEAEFKQQVASASTAGVALANALVPVDESHSTITSMGVTAFQESVFKIIRSEHSEFGISKQNILRQFPSYQGHEVNQAIEYLISEGFIYPTSDQDHLKATSDF